MDRRIRVMHVLKTGEYSGAENVVINMINSYRDEVDAIYVAPDGRIRGYLNENSIKFFPIKKISPKEISKAINACQPDIIQAHDFTTGIICSCSFTKVPIINHIHNNPPWLSKLGIKSIAFGLCCIKYKKIFTVSESIMNECVWGKIFKKKTLVINNTTDVRRIRELAGVVKNYQYDVVFLGRLHEAKNPTLFVDIVSRLKSSIPRIRALMIGDGELRETVENYIAKRNLDNNIVLVGFKSNPYELLNQCRILCMPSKWEGFGLAALEGLALGKPVVGSNCGGLKSIIDDSCGILCDSCTDYVEFITRLLTDNTLYNEMSKAAMIRANELSNMELYRQLICAEYYKILKQ